MKRGSRLVVLMLALVLLGGAIVNVAVALVTSREELAYLSPRHSFDVGPWTVAGAPIIITEHVRDQGHFRILWPGFAINTVFYAVILWLFFVAPFTLRRRRRSKRGLCAKCGYDLRGSPPHAETTNCPECGARRTMPRAGSGPET